MSSSRPDKILLLGGGGHCKVVLDVLDTSGAYLVAGISDVPARQGQVVLGEHRVTLQDADIDSLYPDTRHAFVTHGEDLALRRRLFEHAARSGFAFPVLASPNAYVSRYAQVGDGTLVMHGVAVNASASIGANVIVNTGATVEHDCTIGDHAHVAPGSVVCGGARVGDMTLVGAGSVIIPGLRVGSNVVIGAGSVVIADVPDGVTVAGNPARVVGGPAAREARR